MFVASFLALSLLAQSPDAPDAGLEPSVEAAADASDAGTPEPELAPFDAWWTGDHLTHEWGGARTWLADHGFTFDIVLAAEVFSNAATPEPGDNAALSGHVDVAMTVDTGGLGLWPGGKVYLLGQANLGPGINEFVGSVTEISNIETLLPYVQLGEFFIEQNFFDKVTLRLGKQDANREFGTPRFGGNFINNNFGMLPSMPLPSYPNIGLGGVVVVTPVWWLALKAAVYEGQAQVGSFGFDSAFKPNTGHFLVGGVNVKHHFGAGDKHNGTSSAGFFRQQGRFTEIIDTTRPNFDPLAEPRTFNEMWGFFVQHDERLYLNPADDDDPRCFTIISRVGWTQPDRFLMSLFFSVSIAYHGLGVRKDDTIGIGFGGFSVTRQANGTPGVGSEGFVELFYKWRLTKFMSLQFDLQYIRTPGGDGRDALLPGLRVKFKL